VAQNVLEHIDVDHSIREALRGDVHAGCICVVLDDNVYSLSVCTRSAQLNTNTATTLIILRTTVFSLHGGAHMQGYHMAPTASLDFGSLDLPKIYSE
jgi:hypothetical protein